MYYVNRYICIYIKGFFEKIDFVKKTQSLASFIDNGIFFNLLIK